MGKDQENLQKEAYVVLFMKININRC